MLYPAVETHPPAAVTSEGIAREDDEATIAVFLSRREAFALCWIVSRFLRRVPQPLTRLQERLGGLVAFLEDHLEPAAIDSTSADEGPEQHGSIR